MLILVLLSVALAATVGIRFCGDQMLEFYVFYAVGSLATVLALLSARRIYAQRYKGGGHADLRWLIVIVLVGALTRILFWSFPQPLSIDQFQYRDFETFMNRGLAPYTGFFFPYPQGAALIFSIIRRAADPLAVWRIVILVADLLSIVTIWLVCRRLAVSGFALFAAACYAVMPMTVLESGMNVHLDVLLTLAVVAGYMAFERERFTVAGIFWGFGALLKGWPAILAALSAFACREPRRVLKYSIALIATLIVTSALLGTGVSAVEKYWYTLLPVPGAGSLAGAITASVFAQNSVRALTIDIPALRVLYIIFGALLPLSMILAIVDLWYVDKAPGRILAWLCDKRNLAERLSLGAALLVFAAIGGYHALSPWLAAQYLYKWWTPTPIVALRGWAELLFSLCTIVLVVRYYCLPAGNSRARKIAVHLISISLLSIFLHGNDYGWYLLPLIPLFFVIPNMVGVGLLASCLAYYASYPSAVFARLGFAEHHVNLQGWKVKEWPGPSRSRSGGAADLSRAPGSGDGWIRVILDSPRAQDGFLRVGTQGNCALGRRVVVRNLSHLSKGSAPIIGNTGIVALPASIIPGSEVLAIKVPGAAGCTIASTSIIAPDYDETMGTRAIRDGISAVLRPNHTQDGWAPYVWAVRTGSIPIDNWSALQIVRRSNTDASFGGAAIAFSIWVSGVDANGSVHRNVPVVLQDATTSNDYFIVDRYPLRHLPISLRRIEKVSAMLTLQSPRVREARLQLRDMEIVQEPLVNSKTWLIIGFGLLVFIAVAALMLRTAASGLYETSESADTAGAP
ncbi:DUF2029 domain-containing protein [bacterium]|nr:MAG: DUF2029 domain-containing protein [bacterium]